MTRINLVPPSELMDQHLMAEYREIQMVPSALRRSLRTKTIKQVLDSIPEKFTLNSGHVKFFYNKMLYLKTRYDDLRFELKRRGYNLDDTRTINDYSIPIEFYGQYDPTDEALALIRQRIAERIAAKPHWYRKTPYGIQEVH